jgi:ATP-binding cassette subfamily B protein
VLTFIKQFFAQSNHILRTWQLIKNAAPRWTLAWGILLIFQGALPVAMVYLTRLLVDGLVAAVRAGGNWTSIRPILFPAAMMAGAMLLTELLQGLIEWVNTAQSELIQDFISKKVHTQAAIVDLAFYESPEYFDRLHRAANEASGHPLALMQSGGSLIQNALTLLGMGAVLLPYGVWIPLILVLSTLPALYIVVRFNLRYHQWWVRATQDRRWTQYYNSMITNSAAAAEVRLFGLGEMFREAYQLLRKRLRNERLGLLRQQMIARLGASLLALSISGAAIAWFGWRVIQGVVSLGDLALFYQAFNNGQNLMRSLLGNLGQIYNNSLYLGNLFEFLDLQPEIVDPSDAMPPLGQLKHGIRLENVTFRYPGSLQPALRDFHVDIPAGKVVAIVGENGAGKSTLVKLICRFYDPEQGSIQFDGIDVRQIAISDLRRMISVLFQFPVTYHATARQNIEFGDLTTESDLAAVEAAARSAGAHEVIRHLPKGYDSLLGKWFADGAELSAGEWQKVALARAYWRRSPIIILDEPTSFMDSWSEADWFNRFRGLARGRTAILITHRFTIAMRADIIYVMQAGQIVESGSHEELLAQNGHYAQSWISQTQVQSISTQGED